MTLLRAALPFIFFLFLAQSLPIATACENEVLISTTEARKLLVRAEKSLAQGKYASVVEMTSDIEVKDEALARRLSRVRAVGYLHTNYISMALELLEALLNQTPDDPYLKTRVAEGLSMLRKNKQENAKRALAMLEELDKADLIPDAEGDLVLARLRAAAKDATGSARALARCQKRSSRPAECVLP